MELIEKFGIDWRTLLAQIINFLIVLGVLYAFAYKPLLKILHDRSKKIEKSLKDAEGIEKRLLKIEREKEIIIENAEKKAEKILKDAETTAAANSKQTIDNAKEEVKHIIGKAKKEIRSMKESLLQETKTDLAKIIQGTLEKILKIKSKDYFDEKLIEETVNEVSQRKDRV